MPSMKIEVEVNGESKTFVAQKVPALAKRRYLEMMSRIEKEEKDPDSGYEEVVNFNDQYYSILSDVIFRGQFSLEDLYNEEEEYINSKMNEALYGIKPQDEDGEAGK